MNTAFKISETEKLRPYIGDNLYELQESAHHLCLSLENGAYLFKLEYRNLNSDNLRLSPVTIYCSDDDFLIFSDCLSLPEDKNGVLSDAPFKIRNGYGRCHVRRTAGRLRRRCIFCRRHCFNRLYRYRGILCRHD